jgi:hypothetical protein
MPILTECASAEEEPAAALTARRSTGQCLRRLSSRSETALFSTYSSALSSSNSVRFRHSKRRRRASQATRRSRQRPANRFRSSHDRQQRRPIAGSGWRCRRWRCIGVTTRLITCRSTSTCARRPTSCASSRRDARVRPALSSAFTVRRQARQSRRCGPCLRRSWTAPREAADLRGRSLPFRPFARCTRLRRRRSVPRHLRLLTASSSEVRLAP